MNTVKRAISVKGCSVRSATTWPRVLVMTIIYCCVWLGSTAQSKDRDHPVHLVIDGTQRYQRIDGIGVNANTASWGKELEPAIDLMLDSMNANIWRVIVETVEKWEEKNDNADPFSFNWKYYNRLYETPKFRKAWDMIAYLNKRGVTDNLVVNFMGRVPIWMGGEVVKPEFEDEYIEMLVSFFYYAVKVKHLTIGLISPMNEPDIRKEGPTVGPEQFVRLFRKFVERMDKLGLGHIKTIGPDVAGMENGVKNYIPRMVKDPVVMANLTHFGLHSYAGYYAPIDSLLTGLNLQDRGYWVTEWNAWCKGCDDGILGEYNYDFAAKSVGFLIDLLQHNAKGAMAWEGYDSYYEHHAPSPFSYWGFLAYDKQSRKYTPRKNFYAIQQLSRFVDSGAQRIRTYVNSDTLTTIGFYDSARSRVTVAGINKMQDALTITGSLQGLPALSQLELIVTDKIRNVSHAGTVRITGGVFTVTLPANCIFTLTGTVAKLTTGKTFMRPAPAGWYTGDIHVHKNCGDEVVVSESALAAMMSNNNLDVISLLADMGNGEVLNSSEDMKKITGQDAAESLPGRIVHWDAEWHWDATYSRFEHQALGGHLVLLGLKEAHQIWAESPATVLKWAKDQGAVTGFCHFQYLNGPLQDELNCCIPVEFPVEVALGTVDFVSEDVFGGKSRNNGQYNSEESISAYYKLLNCGFRLGFAAGTDYPCNNKEALGTLLTYVNVGNADLTYRNWIDGIKAGRTVVSRNGHNEFIAFTANEKYSPGDDINLPKKGSVSVEATWTSVTESRGQLELIVNGKVVAHHAGMAKRGQPLTWKISHEFSESGWMCLRRMDEKGHQSHTAPIYVTVDNKKMKPFKADIQFFISWIDKMLLNTAPGGPWNRYFPETFTAVHKRYEDARALYANLLRASR